MHNCLVFIYQNSLLWDNEITMTLRFQEAVRLSSFRGGSEAAALVFVFAMSCLAIPSIAPELAQ